MSLRHHHLYPPPPTKDPPPPDFGNHFSYIDSEWNQEFILLFIIIIYFLFICPWRKLKRGETTAVSSTPTPFQEVPPIPLPSSSSPPLLLSSLTLRLRQPRPPPLIRPVDLYTAVLCHFYIYLACGTDSSPSPSSLDWRCCRHDCRRDWGRCRPRRSKPRRPRCSPVFPPGWSIPLLLLFLLFLLFFVLVLVLILPFNGSICSPRLRPSRGRIRWGGLCALLSWLRRRPRSVGRRRRRGRDINL